jgi:hypothetical protein
MPGRKGIPTQIEPLPALYKLYEQFKHSVVVDGHSETDIDPTVQMVVNLSKWQSAVQDYLSERGEQRIESSVRQWSLENYPVEGLRREYSEEEISDTRNRLLSPQSAVLLHELRMTPSFSPLNESEAAFLTGLGERTLARYSTALYRSGLIDRRRGRARQRSEVAINQEGLRLVATVEQLSSCSFATTATSKRESVAGMENQL